MDLPFPEDLTHVGTPGKLQGEGAQTAPTAAQVEMPIHPSPVLTQGHFQPWHQLFLF